MENYEKSVAELTDRYVYAVTRRLPEAQRADIEKELRGLIDDMLTDRTKGAPPKKEDAEAVLKELGRPAALAAKYRGTKQYLIGPDYYDLYMLIVKIVVIVAPAATALAQIIGNAVTPPENVGEAIGVFFASVIGAAVQAFAVVTFIFAMIDRFAGRNAKIKAPEWKPADLPPVPMQKARINRGEPLAGIIFTIVAIILFNSAPWMVAAGDPLGRTFMPVFNLDVLRTMMPLINVLFALGILKEAAKLVTGRYNLPLALSTAALNIVTLVVYIYVFVPPAIWNADFMMSLYSLYGFPWTASAEAAQVWGIVIKVLIGLTIFGYIVETIAAFTRAFLHGEKRA
jgi:hypothetical protein